MKILLYIILGMLMLPIVIICSGLILFIAVGFMTFYFIKAIYLILTMK